jgi:hypothetical protein
MQRSVARVSSLGFGGTRTHRDILLRLEHFLLVLVLELPVVCDYLFLVRDRLLLDTDVVEDVFAIENLLLHLRAELLNLLPGRSEPPASTGRDTGSAGRKSEQRGTHERDSGGRSSLVEIGDANHVRLVLLPRLSLQHLCLLG